MGEVAEKLDVGTTYNLIVEAALIRSGDVVLEGFHGPVAGKNRSVGTLGKKQTDRDVVGTICTRLVRMETDSPLTVFKNKT